MPSPSRLPIPGMRKTRITLSPPPVPPSPNIRRRTPTPGLRLPVRRGALRGRSARPDAHQRGLYRWYFGHGPALGAGRGDFENRPGHVHLGYPAKGRTGGLYPLHRSRIVHFLWADGSSPGALGHWLRIANGKISNYQVVTPTAGTHLPWTARVSGAYRRGLDRHAGPEYQ